MNSFARVCVRLRRIHTRLADLHLSFWSSLGVEFTHTTEAVFRFQTIISSTLFRTCDYRPDLSQSVGPRTLFRPLGARIRSDQANCNYHRTRSVKYGTDRSEIGHCRRIPRSRMRTICCQCVASWLGSESRSGCSCDSGWLWMGVVCWDDRLSRLITRDDSLLDCHMHASGGPETAGKQWLIWS